MKKKLITLAFALVAGFGLSFGFANRASAVYPQCESGLFCFWDLRDADNINGTMWILPISQWPANQCHYPGSGANNKLTSFKNGYGSSLDIIVYKSANCAASGGSAVLWNGDWGNISSYLDSSWNNNVSSWKTVNLVEP